MKKKKIEKAFLPVSKDEMVERGWYYYDFLVVTADAYIDHPSFGPLLPLAQPANQHTAP